MKDRAHRVMVMQFKRPHPIKITYANDRIKQHVEQLAQPHCLDCQQPFKAVDYLIKHQATEHGRHYCKVCITHKRSVISDLTTYDSEIAVRKHRDKLHPLCKYC